MGKVICFGEGSYLRSLGECLYSMKLDSRRVGTFSQMLDELGEASAIIFEGGLEMAERLRLVTALPRVGIVETGNFEMVRSLMEKGVGEVISATDVEPAWGAVMVAKALCDGERRAADAAERSETDATAFLLRRQAATDRLTGLYSRRQGERCLDTMWGRLRGESVPVGVCLFDIDHFKRVNDTHGHAVGDEVLGNVARHIRSVSRGRDLVVRYGGEEILSVLTGVGESDAEKYAVRAVEGLRAKGVSRSVRSLRVTLSGGILVVPDTAWGKWKDAVKGADELLYQAKRGGRDRYVVECAEGQAA